MTVTDIVGSGRMRFAGLPGVPCPDLALTPAGFYPCIGATPGQIVGNLAYTPADGVTYYWRAGFGVPSVPTPGFPGSCHFPAQAPPGGQAYTRYDAAGLPGSIGDFFTAGLGNTVRLILVAHGGRASLSFGSSSFPDGINTAGASVRVNGVEIFSKQPIGSAYGGSELVVATLVPGQCINIIDVETNGGHFFGYGGVLWEPDYDPGAPPAEDETFALRGSAVVA